MCALVAEKEDVNGHDDGPAVPQPPDARRVPSWLVTLSLVGVGVLGAALRLWTPSKLWLDEALSVNIASLPLGDMFEALKHDGHPPLYYVLLHYWMEVVGDGDTAVRALSGVIGIATLPFAWIAGRRLAGVTGARWTFAVVALSPFCVRYSSETRMYALVMLLVLVGYLVMTDALKVPTWPRLAGIAVVSGLLLLSHYWAIWLMSALGMLLLWRWWRVKDERPATLRVVVAMAAGGVLFLPWLPSFLYQSSHTGTPWGKPFRPTTAVVNTLADMAGGLNFFDGYLLATFLVVLCLLALFVVRVGGDEVVLDMRSTPLVRRELAVVTLTMAVGTLTAFATAATFQSRYAAVIVPLLLVSAGVGIALLPARARIVAGAITLGLSLMGVGWTYYYERTQAPDVAAQVAAHAQPGDVVVYCPDQLGPDFSRAMPDGLVELSYPALSSPERVDWVDYADRQAAANPQAIADEVLDRADGRSVFFVWEPDYRTFGNQCQDVLAELSANRISEMLVQSDGDKYFEPAFLMWMKPT
jgi:hypothetical protein